ncbi:MAG: response regulator, partial [Bryobacteraceae bacterium]
MSHEIRTPMNGIIGMAELALELATGTELRDDLLTIRSSGESLLAVVNQILDFSKMEAGRMELEFLPFRPREVVAEVARLLEPGARKKGLQFAWEVGKEVPPAVLGDPLRLRQVLLNLAGNAVKFTDRGSVSISLSECPPDQPATPGEEAHILEFAIRDTGIGIAANKLKDIFDPFSQADSSMSRRFGGTGLGLTISARLARMMGGEIRVESTPGEGSCFSFRVRVGRAAAPPAETRTQAAVPLLPAAPGLHVLLAEDHPVNRQLAVKMLEKHGYSVTTAENGLRAVELFALQKFDIVLMDIQMPEMNGFEATAAIRKAEAGRSRVPILALTAHSADRDRACCLAADMDDYLPKPIRSRDLLAALERNMARRGALGIVRE